MWNYTSGTIRRLTVAIVTWIVCITNSIAADAPLRVLVSGYQPWGGLAVNPTEEVVNCINTRPSDIIPGATLHAVSLPVSSLPISWHQWPIWQRE